MEDDEYSKMLNATIQELQNSHNDDVRFDRNKALELLKEARDRKDVKPVSDMVKLFQEILEFNNKYFPNWREPDDVFLTNAIAGEVGELCNMVKHNAGGGTNQQSHGITEMADECADIFIYLSIFLQKHNVTGIEFRDLIQMKIEENIERIETPPPKEVSFIGQVPPRRKATPDMHRKKDYRRTSSQKARTKGLKRDDGV